MFHVAIGRLRELPHQRYAPVVEIYSCDRRWIQGKRRIPTRFSHSGYLNQTSGQRRNDRQAKVDDGCKWKRIHWATPVYLQQFVGSERQNKHLRNQSIHQEVVVCC